MPAHNRRRPSSTQKTLPFTNSTKISKANTTPSSLKSRNPPTNPSKPTSTTLKESISTTPTPPPTSSTTLKESISTTPTPPPTSSTTPNSLNPNPNPNAKPTTKTKTTTQPPIETHHHTLASQIPDAQIHKYWKSREALRLSPRVHQKNLETSEKVLREWDCMSQFGPAIGITRTQRWHRASRLGLNPPIEVLAVLVREEGRRRNGGGERAYVDELMN